MELIHLNKNPFNNSTGSNNFYRNNNNNNNNDTDMNLIIQLGKELQKRIGILPKVENYTFILKNSSSQQIHMLYVKPKSYSEISRTIRAARTMKLIVRGCGQQSSYNINIYGKYKTVLIDCTELSDSLRIQFVNIKRKNEIKEIQGLKILSCVTINELINYQISHNIEINQSIDTCSLYGTVVGSIVTTQSGIVGPNSNAIGSCLTDEVITIRIVDCHGDLIEYSSEEEIKAAVSNLGLLGIVYDVTLRYSPITLTKVNYKFYKWADILDSEKAILKNALTTDQSIELIYLPYNSCPTVKNKKLATNLHENTPVVKEIDDDVNNNNNNEGKANKQLDLTSWNSQQDEVLLRTTQRLSSKMTIENPYTSVTPTATTTAIVNSEDSQNENDDPFMYYDSDPQQFVYLLDEVFGPFINEFIEQPCNTPKLLKTAHKYLKYKYCPQPTTIQYTPWALNSFGKFKDPFRIIKFTMETDYELNQFILAIYTILDVLHKITGDQLINGVNNFSVNLGLRVQFTRGTTNGRLMGVGLENDNQPDRRQLLLAHITFMGLTSSSTNKLWNDAASQIVTTMLTKIPNCMPQWKTEWHVEELMFNKFREALKEQAEPLKKLIAIADRDGMFLNEHLASIFYSKLTFYQDLYQSQRNNYLSTI
ncbi:unnamed protein product [Heterobilharzia americana]|nr:unnamed protein product [Heterobilharzia americana]